jgi:exopolysaccharide biosynthesis polyprenyl glycosylphosphotransferase
MVAIAVVSRIAGLFVIRHLNRRIEPAETAIVVGAGETGAQLARHLLEHREYGIEPLGFVDRVVDDDLPLPVLGDVDNLDRILRSSGARHLLVAFGVVPEDDLVRVIRRCQLRDVDVWVIPRFFELGLPVPSGDAEEVWGIPLARLPRRALRSAQWRLKRVFDLTLSGTALVLLAPALGAISLAVRISSPGPVFFRQERVGQRGRAFELLKFRTMLVNEDSPTTWSVEDDQRVTRVGRFLRRTSLDELPQLLNVVRGDMSLVGPRPERPYFVEKFRDEVRGYDDRHRVPVGITGLAQVNGLRGDTSIKERAVFDNNYIENWSLWADVRILARTAVAVMRPVRVTSPEAELEPAIDLRRASDAQLELPRGPELGGDDRPMPAVSAS